MRSSLSRQFAAETYPTRGGVGGQGLPYARNSAQQATNGLLTTTAATPVHWVQLEIPNAGGTNVPITPRVTGVLLVIATIGVSNADTVPHNLTVTVAVGGGGISPAAVATVPAGGSASVPVQCMLFSESEIGTTLEVS